MNSPIGIVQESDSSDGRDVTGKLDFVAIYDRYAPALLGVIARIIPDKDEAVGLLEQTFIRVRLEIGQARTEQQPLFTWLLSVAKGTALEAIRTRKQIPATIFQLTTTGQIVALPNTIGNRSNDSVKNAPDPRLKQLMDSVLFKNCTPEEAAATIGLPVETARQQLRLAMQQLRSQPKL